MPKVETNGINMHYEMVGEGEPLLCIMGITANHEVWEDHVEVWSQHFQCITPDNRGVGETDQPEGSYTSAMMADDLAVLLDEIGVDSAHVVGCSMGSIIAQQMALRHPDKVKSLVLMCSWARCDGYATATFNHLKTCKAKLQPAEFMEWIQLIIFDKRSWDNPEVFESFLQARQDAQDDENPQSITGLNGQADACINHNVLDQLSNIHHRTLVIGGENDIFTPRWMADEIHAALPNSTLHLYPASGHAFHWENLDDFNSRVTDFVKTNA